jgi:type II secretory pathway component PulL
VEGYSDDRASPIFFNKNKWMDDLCGAGCCVASAWAVDMSPVGDGSGWGLLGSCSYWIILSAIGDSHGKQANKKGRQAPL